MGAKVPVDILFQLIFSLLLCLRKAIHPSSLIFNFHRSSPPLHNPHIL